MGATSKCSVCGKRHTAMGERCLRCKTAVRRALGRVCDEGLLVEAIGTDWWVWDARGEVLVNGASSRTHALEALAGLRDARLE